jgi:uncharacterized 2Fe-2S/4Fe-4S cluster protein (DUF4445 family)
VNFSPGTTIFEISRDAGIELVSLCGGIGSCDSCRVQLISGELTQPTIEEEALFGVDELKQGWRLACQARPISSIKLAIPPESLSTPQRLQLEGESLVVPIDFPYQIVKLAIDPANIRDLRSDTTRVKEASKKTGIPITRIDYPVLSRLPYILREHNWQASVAVDSDGSLVAALPPDTTPLGLAVDIGTTSIAAYLVDLVDGAILEKMGEMNPQIAFGEDVVSRIQYTNENHGGGAHLQALVVDTINRLAADLCDTKGYKLSQIVDVVMVGNTAMHHLFAGLPVKQLGESPYVPVTSESLSFEASRIGIDAGAGAALYSPPIIAGYVGADHTAMLLSTGVWQTDKTSIAIDVGTNTEVSLCHEGRILCCSCASGPAFEGAHISMGMRAARGAIERVQLINGDVRIWTIGEAPALGLCGSGIVDAIAVMVESEVINHRGAYQKGHELVSTDVDGKQQFILVPKGESGIDRPISVSRKDVSEIQLAKGAIRTGIEILLIEAGIDANAVEQFIIAGAFGSYINVGSAIKLGLFPSIPLKRFRQVGNAAGMGAYQLLISQKSRDQADLISEKLEYVELTTHPNFSDEFIRQMSF